MKNVHRRRKELAGLVQISTWVPVSKKLEVLAACRRLKNEHLRSVGFGHEDPDGRRRIVRDGPYWEDA